ncbi:MAG: SRPBCC family protein [Chloroflexi bacterium]|nr:SRPBCC family protein [Chloroflexota bacterium]
MAKLNLVAEPGSYEIRMTREFDAPREQVFKAMTDPALVPRWWGPSSVSTVVDRMEVKPGGMWRYVQREQDGTEYGFHGVYHAVEALERLVFTFEFEGMPGHVLLETVTFEEHSGKTRVIDSSVFQSVADRDGMLRAGMESGASESWERLEALLPEIQL